MGLLVIHHSVPQDMIEMAFRFLEREHDSEISSLCVDVRGCCTSFFILGNGIPDGSKKFAIVFEEIVDKVYILNIAT